MDPIKISYLSTISIGNLLIFYTIGVALLVLAIQLKISTTIRKKDYKLARYAGIFNFIKTVFNWGVFYFFSALLILIASMFDINESFWRPLFYNLSFSLAGIITFFFTFAYIVLVIKELVVSWAIANKYNL